MTVYAKATNELATTGMWMNAPILPGSGDDNDDDDDGFLASRENRLRKASV